LPSLFSEELGAVVQVRSGDVERVLTVLARHGVSDCAHPLGTPTRGNRIAIRRRGETLFEDARSTLRGVWSETTHALQSLRDDPACAAEEQELRVSPDDPGIGALVPFDSNDDIAAPFVRKGARPRVAILREQGVNGQIEMAAAFHRAGFESIDVHMSDVLSGDVDLGDFVGLAACGGFSYGDVLGAGEGWAKTILFHSRARDAFQRFFERKDTFSLGVCNGCQMLSNLRELIPGTSAWPRFVKNRSERFEARLCVVRIEPSPSILFSGMETARLPIVVAHGEGRTEFEDEEQRRALEASGLVAARYVDHAGNVTEHYPENPNGSAAGVTALTSADGRATILMPHPERVFRVLQYSYHPRDWHGDAPFLRLFRNARAWVG
jgi:phosphoribosylformylglycinamidine synthase